LNFFGESRSRCVSLAEIVELEENSVPVEPGQAWSIEGSGKEDLTELVAYDPGWQLELQVIEHVEHFGAESSAARSTGRTSSSKLAP